MGVRRRLGWLPSIGRLDVKTDLDRRTNLFVVDSIISANWAALWDTIRHLILPAIALGTIPLAIITRITRTAVLEVMQEDHVRTARAKGLPPRAGRSPAHPAQRPAPRRRR